MEVIRVFNTWGCCGIKVIKGLNSAYYIVHV